MPESSFEGCGSEPLLDYLKGLGLFRLVATQMDPEVRAFWRNESLVLDSRHSAEQIEAFLLNGYSPSPLVDPWNKDSGFPSSSGDKVSHRAVREIIGAKAHRLSRYRSIAAMCDDLASRFQPGDKDEKKAFLSILRASVPDDALEWLDAVFVLAEEKPGFPPLLGSGGNDGRLDFVNCFMRMIQEVMDPETGAPTPMSRRWLDPALHECPAGGLKDQTIGQFDPGGTGGVNASSSFAGGSLTNPWSFILALEGTLVFSASASRRLDGTGDSQMTYPFTVRPTRAGYASASDGEKLRGEMWMPLWSKPASFAEVSALFGEGRATLSGRTAHSGLEFARAVASLGVDRGLDSFTRYLFAERNGKNNYAVPVGRFRTFWAPQTDLLDEIAPWVESLYRARESSHSLAALANSIEASMLRFCQAPGRERLRTLFILLGKASALLARSPGIPIRNNIIPLDGLSTGWITETADGSPEFRLAAGLASIHREDGRLPVRLLVEPVSFSKKGWLEYGQDPARVSLSSGIVDVMLGLLDRMSLDEYPWNRSHYRAAPGDISAFIEGLTDDSYLLELFQAMLTIKWRDAVRDNQSLALGRPRETEPGAEYWMLKFCWASENDIPNWSGTDRAVIRAAIAGNHQKAVSLSAARMKALGRKPVEFEARIPAERARRIVAALLIPVRSRSLVGAACRLAPASSEQTDTEGEFNVG